MRRRFSQWLQPSLARRVLLSVLIAFGMVLLVLLAQSYLEFRQEFSAGPQSSLVQAVRIVGASLDDVSSAHDAQVILGVVQKQSDMARREAKLSGTLLIELRDRDGQRVYATKALGNSLLAAPSTGQDDQVIAGRHYRVTQATAGPWQLRMAEPRLTDAKALRLLGGELVPSLLIAFPFVFLPVWFAVRQALQPLRRLSARMAQRDGHDLAPLDVDLKYAELQPMVSAFNELLAKLRDKVQRERAFVQDAAHELRTPMAVIAAQAHVLARAASEAERHHAEGALELAIQRASHLAQQLLELASLDVVGVSRLQRIDLAHLLQQMLSLAEPIARQRGMELTLEAPDRLAMAVDLPAVQSIAQNLIDNALRHGRAGGQVQVSLSADDVQVQLTVADDGPGIAEADRLRVFERFVRGSHVEASGTGLGLAIVKQAVLRTRGTIETTAGLHGLGVGFKVIWPLPEPEEGST